MTKRQQVLAWIADNFDLSAVTIEPSNLLPFAHIVKDQQGGQMVVYYDLLTDSVKYKFPD